jgi:subtilase family serine protease
MGTSYAAGNAVCDKDEAMKPRDNPDLQVWPGGFPSSAADAAAADFIPWVWSDGTDSGHAPSAVVADASFLSPGTESDGLQNGPNDDIVALVQGENPDGDLSHPISDAVHVSDAAPTATEGSSTPPPVAALPTTTALALPFADGVNPLAGFVAAPMPEAASTSLFMAPAHADYQIFITGLPAAAHGAAPAPVAATVEASLTGPAEGFSGGTTDASVGSHGATAAQVQQALDESGFNANGGGIKVGVLSDSFNDLGGYANDEADGALPAVQVLADISSGGTDEGRAMLQVVHDIAPNASLAFYTADEGEQAFANGILALAAAGCKVICDDVSYFDEPFFGGGVIAQAIQTVESEGVTYITSAGNNASNGYQATWTPTSGSFGGINFTDAQNFGGSIVQTVTVTTDGTDPLPLLFEWNQAYGAATPGGVNVFVFHNGTLYGDFANNRDGISGEQHNPFIYVPLPTSGTYQIVVENESGPNPGIIKEISEGDGLPVTISDANSGTVFGHGLTPGVITVGAVSTADTPAFGFGTPTSESFSSSGAGSELLYASNGTALSSPEAINPVAVSSVDNISTTLSLSSGLGDFYGTSAASASLAGVAALILAADPSLTAAQVEQIMAETAAPMSNASVSGAGLVQVDAALALLPADLTEYVAVSDTTMAADGSITVDAYDMNIGHSVAGSSTAKIYLSTSSTITTFDTVLATLNSGPLTSVGQTGYYDHQTFTVALPNGLAPGTYYIGGIADYNNQVSEGNENNNTYNVVPITVTAPVSPDLTEYVAVNHTTVAAGDSITIDAYDMNIGDGISGASTAQIYLSTDSTITTSDTVLATLTSPQTLMTVSLPGYYDHQQVTVALPGNLAPGTYYIGGIADYNNHISETNETNNTYNVVKITVTPPPQPDLTEYVAVNHTTVAAGDSITIDAYDMNIGDGISGASTAQIYLSTDSTITTSDMLLATLTSSETLATVSQPGYYDHQTFTVNLPGNLAPGTYYIGGIADYNNHVSESNETNNTYNVVQVTVTPPPQPDLTEYVAVNHTTVAAGDSITIDAYDMNIGNAVSGASTAQIYLSTSPTITTSDTVLATVTSPETLATVGQPGYYDHQQVTVALPGNLAPGTYYIGGIADYNNQVSESNETNNTYNVVQVTVTPPPQPDLTEYVAVNHTTVAAGGSLTIDAYDMNIGNAVSGASTAQIYLSTSSTITTSDTVLATLTNSAALATVSQPGYYDHQTFTVTLPGNLAPGTYYIGGIADYNNQVSESNETNNTYNVVQITVPAAVSQSTTPAQSAVATQVAATTANASLGQLFAGSGSDNFVFAANPGNGAVASYPPAQGHVEFNHPFAAAALDPAAWHLPATFDAGASLSPSGPGVDALYHLHDFHIV